MTRPRRRVARAKFPRDRWMVAYADMITLLFACFVSLYAARMNSFAASPGDEGRRLAAASTALRPSAGSVLSQRADADAPLWRALQAVVSRASDLGALELTADARGIVISLPEAGAFPEGTAEMTPAAARAVLDLARVLAGAPNLVRVEGHTDNVPVHTSTYASNWDLSTARATRVVQFMVDRTALAPARLSAAGYGEFRPRASNTSPGGRARNRRVDIVILSAAIAAAQEPAAIMK